MSVCVCNRCLRLINVQPRRRIIIRRNIWMSE